MTNDTSGRLPKSLSASDLQAWLHNAAPPRLVDVREQQELDIAPFPKPVLHLPLSEAEAWIDDLPTLLDGADELVVLCHAGVRSWQFGCWLLARDPARAVWNLHGGIEAWSVEVDPTTPRY